MEKSMSPTQAKESIKNLTDWKLHKDNKIIYREYVMKDFVAAVDLIKKIAQIAQKMNHHPNIHLTGYRKLRVELTTDDIGGLSEKDFIEAAKINKLPADLKS